MTANLTANPVGKTVASMSWATKNYDHDVCILRFTDGTEMMIASTTGYEESSIEILEPDDLQNVQFNGERPPVGDNGPVMLPEMRDALDELQRATAAHVVKVLHAMEASK